MKKGLFFLTVANLLFVYSIFAFQNAGSKRVFVKNNGQWPGEVKYLASIPGINAWITNRGVVYDFYKITGSEAAKNISKYTPANEVREIENKIIVRGDVVRAVYENSDLSSVFTPEEKQNYHYNYFIGSERSKWVSNVPIYRSVTSENIYPGIDIRYYFDNGLLRYDYEVSPGADISQIKLKFIGIEKVLVNEEGELLLQTSIGKITHGKIYAYQSESEISCDFIKLSEDVFGISVPNYDKTKKLTIDPLVYCSYLGGSFSETFNSIVVDENNNAVVAGETRSPDFPTTPGAYSQTLAGDHDVVVTKFNQDATDLVFSTFVGGADFYEEAKSVAIDDSGSVYITGITWSHDYPVTTLYTVFGGTQYYDAFLTKLDGNTGDLIYSTFLGGSGGDEGLAIALDNENGIYITGYTGSTDFPITSGAFSDTLAYSSVDIFITKLIEYSFPGVELVNQYSTFLGGGGQDEARDMVVDENFNVYLSGLTKSTNFPVTANAAFPSYAGGLSDGYILKFGMQENDILYSTFLGGSDADYIDGLAIDNVKNIYVTGTTYSTDFPSTSGAFQATYNGGYLDCFVTKINPNESSPVYSTFLGTLADEQAFDIVTDDSHRAFITGYTNSNLFPLTTGALYDYLGGWDGFITGFSPDGSSLEFSTYFGGANYDYPFALTFDNEYNIYLTGQTFSNDLPVSTGAFQDTFVWMADAFIAKIEPVITSVEEVSYCIPQKFALYQNYPNPFNPATTIAYSLPALETNHALSVQLKIYDVLGRKVATLVNEKQAPGNYEVQFDAGNLSSGVYLYTIQYSGEIISKKMILLK